jgi:2-dehydropantoate 2-reductase
VGGLLAGALARKAHEVVLLMRPESLAAYPGWIALQSAALGDFEVDVPAEARLSRPVDVLWVTVKSQQLETALALAPPDAVGDALVVPLLNGIDHVARLRAVYGDRVVPGAIRVEAERVGPGRIVHPSPFASTDLAPPPALAARTEQLAAEMKDAGLAANVQAGREADVLWGKLAMLCPMALATSSRRQPIGPTREDPETRELMLACSREVCAVATAEGAQVDPERYIAGLLGAPESMRSSMQKDLTAGRPLELDFIAGPVISRGREHGIPTPATVELDRRVRDQAAG